MPASRAFTSMSAERLQRAEQRGGIIGHARARRRQRGVESDLQVQSFRRGPNSAVPTRTIVAPSSMAASRSCDMPIDKLGQPVLLGQHRAAARNKAATSRRRPTTAASSSIPADGDSRSRESPPPAPATSAGSAPALASSADSFTSTMTSSGFPLVIQPPGQLWRIDGLDHVENLGGFLRLCWIADARSNGTARPGNGPSSGRLVSNSCT